MAVQRVVIFFLMSAACVLLSECKPMDLCICLPEDDTEKDVFELMKSDPEEKVYPGLLSPLVLCAKCNLVPDGPEEVDRKKRTISKAELREELRKLTGPSKRQVKRHTVRSHYNRCPVGYRTIYTAAYMLCVANII